MTKLFNFPVTQQACLYLSMNPITELCVATAMMQHEPNHHGLHVSKQACHIEYVTAGTL